LELVEAFGIPEESLAAPIALDPDLPYAQAPVQQTS
jgi:hypothetical protein